MTRQPCPADSRGLCAPPYCDGYLPQGGDPMTAQPKPTAADKGWGESLAEQVAVEALYAVEPDEHPHSAAAFIAARQRVDIVLAALSEAGLLATAEHDAQVAAQALRQWADDVDQTYPTDVFRPVAPTWLAQVHAFCQQHGRTLDAISAHVMRQAARIARQDADRLAGGGA